MTTRLSEPERARLRAVAEQATPGPWRSDGAPFGVFYVFDAAGDMIADGSPDAAPVAQMRGVGAGRTDAQMRANAAHIAAFSPDVALRLLAELDRLSRVEQAKCETCRFWKPYSLRGDRGECNNGASPCADLSTAKDFGCTLHALDGKD